MADQIETRMIFKCNYTDPPLFDRIFVWGFSICMVIVLVLIPQAGYIAVIFALIYMLIPLWFEFGIYMVKARSSLELTDNEIIVRRWMCRHKSFPIDKIDSIHIVDFDKDKVDKLMQDYRLPMAMGRVNLYPRKGVIVFFNRKWIKSVQPILFNPMDCNQFATALSNISGKPVSE